MSLLDTVLGSGNGAVVKQLADQFGLSQSQAQSAIGQLLPALSAGLQRNAAQESGLRDLDGALERGNHQRYLEDPSLLAQAATLAEGNGILGHLLGAKDVSREVAKRAAANTGLDTGILKQMLPTLATVAMGALGQQRTQSGGVDQIQGGAASALGMLNSFLDTDGDGSAIDDVAGMFKKFL